MSTYDGAYSDGRMKTIYPEERKKEPKQMTEAERMQYEKEYQAMKDFDFAGMFSK